MPPMDTLVIIGVAVVSFVAGWLMRKADIDEK